MKKSWKIVVTIGLVILMSSVLTYAVSRHTKAQAPTRYTATIAEGETITKTISCYDPDGDPVIIDVEGIPAGGAVSAQIDAPAGYVDADLPPVPADAPNAKWYTRTFSWTPTYQQAGTYTIYIHATDDNADDDWVKYEITVTNTNRPPVL